MSLLYPRLQRSSFKILFIIPGLVCISTWAVISLMQYVEATRTKRISHYPPTIREDNDEKNNGSHITSAMIVIPNSDHKIPSTKLELARKFVREHPYEFHITTQLEKESGCGEASIAVFRAMMQSVGHESYLVSVNRAPTKWSLSNVRAMLEDKNSGCFYWDALEIGFDPERCEEIKNSDVFNEKTCLSNRV